LCLFRAELTKLHDDTAVTEKGADDTPLNDDSSSRHEVTWFNLFERQISKRRERRHTSGSTTVATHKSYPHIQQQRKETNSYHNRGGWGGAYGK